MPIGYQHPGKSSCCKWNDTPLPLAGDPIQADGGPRNKSKTKCYVYLLFKQGFYILEKLPKF